MSRAIRFVPTLFQVCLLAAFWLGADALARAVGSPVPGGVLALAALLALLLLGWLDANRLRRGAEWLMAEMLLFFIPPVVAVVQFQALFRSEGLKLLAVIGLGTLCVMAGTALVVDRVFRWEHRRRIRGIARRRRESLA
ncbi:CidA/LrgA family protein [Chitiniphilus eburneus]|uniref:CidA/LrgA family protein n=1 Tax=Chitiniphilus eburneus TaxID=2571148 RepID=A0A4U0PP84_9NEIS|nr:CidA/LrgA family protein [Chitiniphilus eburneus]TJZ70083.1 CidA/LrgA family protein [Chitiniphilus eburneus]